MQGDRKARLESLIHNEVSLLLSQGQIKDPRLSPVTVTQVQLTPDYREVKVFVLMLGVTIADPNDEKQIKAFDDRCERCLEGLNSAAGYVRHHLSKALTLKFIPLVTFVEDRGLLNQFRVEDLLAKVKTESEGESGKN